MYRAMRDVKNGVRLPEKGNKRSASCNIKGDKKAQNNVTIDEAAQKRVGWFVTSGLPRDYYTEVSIDLLEEIQFY